MVNALGKPTDVIIAWAEFHEISGLLGLDLDEASLLRIELSQADGIAGDQGAYVNLEDV
jgi:hypothetical protein